MRLVGRALLGAFALLFAIPAGALALAAAALLDPVVGGFAADVASASFWILIDWLAALDDPDVAAGDPFAGIGRVATVLLVAPPALIGLLGEVLGLRAFLWYTGATGALTAALPWLARTAAPRAMTSEELRITLALFLAGAAAGAVYWLIAGRSTGPERRRWTEEGARRLSGPAS
jgi:hypothetical protein